MNKLLYKLLFLFLLSIPILTACSNDKDFSIEGNWIDATKNEDTNPSFSIVKEINFDSKGLALITYEDGNQTKIGYTFSTKEKNKKKYGNLTLNFTDQADTSSDVLKIKDKSNQIKLDIGYPLLLERTNKN